MPSLAYRTIFALFVCAAIYGCASVDTAEIDNLNDDQILILGHAGMGFTSVVNPFNPYPPNGLQH